MKFTYDQISRLIKRFKTIKPNIVIIWGWKMGLCYNKWNNYQFFQYKKENNLNKNNRILVVGGTGFIGTNVCNYFKKKRFEVTSISLSRPTKINKVLGANCANHNRDYPSHHDNNSKHRLVHFVINETNIAQWVEPMQNSK